MKRMLKTVIAAAFTLSTILSSVVAPMTASAETAAVKTLAEDSFDSYDAGYQLGKSADLSELYVGVGTATVISDETAPSGGKAVQFVRQSGTTSGVYVGATVDVKAGVKYIAKVKVKKYDPETSTRRDYHMRVEYASGGTALAPSVNRVSYAVRDGGWKDMLIEYTSDIDNRVSFQLVAWNDGGYIDDFCIYEAVSDPTFEAYPTTGLASQLSTADVGNGTRMGIDEYFTGYATAQVVDTESYSGSKSVKFIRDAKEQEQGAGKGSGAFVAINKEVKAGVKYIFVANVKRLENVNANMDFRMRVISAGVKPNPEMAWSGHSVLAVKDDEWHRIEHSYTSAIDNTVCFQVALWNAGGYVDDFYVYEEGEDPDIPLMNDDPTFETTEEIQRKDGYEGAPASKFYNGISTATIVDTIAASGEKSVKVVRDSGTASGAFVGMNVEIKAGKTYIAEAKVKRLEGYTGDKNYQMRLLKTSAGALSPAAPQSHSIMVAETDNSWQTLTLTYKSDIDNTVAIQVVSWTEGYYVDDFYIYEEGKKPYEDPEVPGLEEDEIIKDGSFEELSGALSGSTSANNVFFIYNAAAEPSTDYANTGKKSLKVTPSVNYAEATGKNYPGLNIYVSLKAGKKYTASAYVCQPTETGYTKEGSLYIRFMDSNGKVIVNSPYTSHDKVNGFTKLSVELEPEQDYEKARISLCLAKGYIAYVDDFSCIEQEPEVIEPTPEPVVIKDGTFESSNVGDILPERTNNLGEFMCQHGTATVVDTTAANGDKSVKFIRNEGTSAGVFVGIRKEVKAGHTYSATAKVKRLEGTGEEKFAMRVENVGDEFPYANNFWTNANDDEWHDAYMNFTPTQDYTAIFEVVLWNDGGYIDDFFVYDYDVAEVREFGISDANFTYSADGENFARAGKTNIKDGTYKYELIVNNPDSEGAEAVEFAPIIALYDENDALINVNVNRTVIEVGAKDTAVSVTLAVSGAPAGAYIKTFAWNMDTLKNYELPPLKILIVGNSVTQHPYAPNIGWLGTWGMAATSEDKDYVHRLMAMTNADFDNVQFKWSNFSEFEKNFYDLSKIPANRYKEYVDYDADIIIAYIGGNINNAANESDKEFETGIEFKPEHYENIINYFNPGNDAKIISAVSWLTSDPAYSIIEETAAKNNWLYIDFHDLDSEENTAVPFKDADVFDTAKLGSGVLRHPGDNGMLAIAERFYEVIKPIISDIK